MNIGERIKKLRKEKGLSVDYIAEKLGKIEQRYIDMKVAKSKIFHIQY